MKKWILLPGQVQKVNLVKYSDESPAVPSPSASQFNWSWWKFAEPKSQKASRFIWRKWSSYWLCQVQVQAQMNQVRKLMLFELKWGVCWLAEYHGEPFELNIGTSLKSYRPAKSEGQPSNVNDEVVGCARHHGQSISVKMLSCWLPKSSASPSKRKWKLLAAQIRASLNKCDWKC